MSKRRDDSQLNLDLSPTVTSTSDSKFELQQQAPARVVSFSDAATLQVRRDAVRRVTTKGIFALPSNLRCDGK